MKQRRLFWLLAVLALLLTLRVLDRRSVDVTEAVVPAITRVQPVIARPRDTAVPAIAVPQLPDGVARAEPELDEPRNPFALRVPLAPPPQPAAMAVAPVQAPKLPVGPPPPPPPPPEPPPPSYQVIGAWEDARGMSVFIADASRMVQVRVGDALFAEYRVLQITATQVAIRHLGTQREYRLSVARAPTDSR